MCWDGGDLLCCDYCPGAFHPECLGLTAAHMKALERKRWSCPHHTCRKCDRNTGRAGGLLFRCARREAVRANGIARGTARRAASWLAGLLSSGVPAENLGWLPSPQQYNLSLPYRCSFLVPLPGVRCARGPTVRTAFRPTTTWWARMSCSSAWASATPTRPASSIAETAASKRWAGGAPPGQLSAASPCRTLARAVCTCALAGRRS